VDDYNSLLDRADDSKTKSILRAANSLKSNARANEKTLEKAGITVDADGRLSVDEKSFEKADMERVERYTEEKMMRRVVDSLRPQHKVSKPAGKRKDKKEDDKKDEKKPKEKIRHRVTKNKGKPDWAKKHAQKAAEAEKKATPAK
jgi:hypothetical protein